MVAIKTMLAFLVPTTGGAIVLGIVVLLLFGNRLPSVMRSLGEGVTEFKKGLNGGDSSTDPNRRLEDRRD